MNEWTLPKPGGMKISDEEDDQIHQHFLFPNEAESLVESLKRFELSEVGNEAWMKQHVAIERLNQQAHASAREKSDEFVLEAMVTFDKMETLVYDLVLVEAWREHVFPLLKTDICGGEGGDLSEKRAKARTSRAYFVLYHEATVVNFLEILCYHAHSLSAARDSTVDLLDYCARRLAQLQGRCEIFRESSATTAVKRTAREVAEELETMSPMDELEQQALEIEFSASVSCVALVRFICQHLGELSVSAVTRILETHDFLLSIVPLLDNPPWTRKRGSTWEKLDEEGKWQVVAPDRLLELTKFEAQTWLSLYYLTMHPEVRKRYGFDSHRKQTLLKARRFINAVLLDQLPILAELQRFVDELSIADVPEPTALDRGQGYLLMKQVAEQRERVLRGADFVQIADSQRNTLWRPRDANTDKDLARIIDIYTGEEAQNDQGAEDAASAEIAAVQTDEVSRSPPPVVEIVDEDDEKTVGAENKREIDGNEPLSLEKSIVESVEIACEDEIFVLEREDSPPKVIPGPTSDSGDFLRTKWTMSEKLVISKNSDFSLRVEWSPSQRQQDVDTSNLDLPEKEPAPKKLWRQLGDDDLAVQLQLVRTDIDDHENQETCISTPLYRVRHVYLATAKAV